MFEIHMRFVADGKEFTVPCRFDVDLADAHEDGVLRTLKGQFLFAQNLLTKKIGKEAQALRQSMVEIEKEKGQ